MIKLKSFAITETDKVNKFIEANPPIHTKDGSGIIMKDSFIIVIYEDGTFNEKAVYKSMTDYAINDAKQNIVNKRIAVHTADHELGRLVKEEVYKGKSDSDVIAFFQKSKELSYKQSQEMCQLVRELEQKKWIAEKDLERMTKVVIPALEALKDSEV